MTISLLVAFAFALGSSVTQHDQHAQHKGAMDRRGNQAMGFDQAKIRHTFTTGARGGAIEVIAKSAKDSETIGRIRSHLREIAKLFKEGDFSKPIFIHAENPPGAETMKARRAEIEYRFEEIPAGGKVVVSSPSADVVQAIHAFMAFQRGEHK